MPEGAFSHPDIADKYTSEHYIQITKVGRIAASHFDYSPDWVRYSVRRLLERFKTSYLNVVFCHDIEYVTGEGAVTAIGVLWKFVATGQIQCIGISGYPIDKLFRVARLARRDLVDYLKLYETEHNSLYKSAKINRA